jgi:hypothetical protein
MANIPLIPGAQQTFSRFKRREKKTAVDFDINARDQSRHPKRSLKRRLGDRRKMILRIRLERRSSQDRRNLINKNTATSNKENLTGKGRHINTTA